MGFERGRSSRIGRVVLMGTGVLLAWLLWTGAAVAAPVRLAGFSVAGCLAGPRSFENCASKAVSLDGPAAVVVSPDGRDVYLAQPESGTVAFFRRNARTGA